MAIQAQLAILASLFLALSAAGRLSPRLEVGDQFNLYAWGGRNISGLSVFYSHGAAFIADFATANATDDLVPVSFTIAPGKSRGFAFTASPNATAPVDNEATRKPPFTSAAWVVSARGSAAHRVSFVADGAAIPADVRSDGFLLSARSAILIESSGLMLMSVYCAFPTATPGLWSLSWNRTADSKDGVPVQLRTFPYPAGAPPLQKEGSRCRTVQ